MAGRFAALAALLIVLAGCGGPVDLTDQTPAPGEDAVAPGVTSEGAVDPDRLAAAHAASLRGRSYTLRAVTNVTTTRGTARIDQTLRVDADRDRVYEARYEGAVDDVFVGRFPDRRRGWSTGNRTYAALTEDGDTSYYNMSRYYEGGGTDAFLVVDLADTLRRYVADANRTAVERVRVGGWRAYRVRAVDRGNETASDDVVASLIVDPFGLVRRLRIDAPADSLFLTVGEGRVRIELRYRALGNTTVERPAWVDHARNASDGRRIP